MLLHPPHSRNKLSALRSAVALGLAVLALAAMSILQHLTDLRGTSISPAMPVKPGSVQVPLAFEPNMGQADPAARYIAHASGGALFFAPSEVTLALSGASGSDGVSSNIAGEAALPRGTSAQQKPNTAVPRLVRLSFIGSNPSVSIAGQDRLPGNVNYLIGDNPARWHSDLPTFAGVTYKDLYPGIDLHYAGTQAQLKGTYTVAPGADPLRIRWQYGNSQVSVDGNGDLRIASATGSTSVTEKAPVAWQEIEGRKAPVNIRYLVHDDGTIGFRVGSYDTSQALTIDPTIVYSTYLGGFYRDVAYSIAVDSAGNMYVTGETISTDFPLAGDPFQPGYGGGNNDIFVSKLSADGSTLLYSTFLGGNGVDFGRFIQVDGQGNATIGGGSSSDDFPTTPGVYQQQFVPNEDVVVAKLNPSGSGLVFSTYWGGGVLSVDAFATDAAGNIYFTGYVQRDLFNWALVGAVSSDGTQELFNTYLGGDVRGPGDTDANSGGQGIAVDGNGDIYVTGFTRAADFPVTQGAYRTFIEAYEDGFVTKLKASDHSMVYSTYIPGQISEYPYDIAADAEGNAYITGFTDSSDYPTTAGAFERSSGDVFSAYVTKLNPTGTDLVYSTFLAGRELSLTADTRGLALRVNAAGNAYVAGYTTSLDFPTENAIQPTLAGESDAFLTKFNPEGTGVEFSTYLGGTDIDYAEGLTLHGSSDIYMVGGTLSTDLPVARPYQAGNHGDHDAFIMKISEAALTPTPTITGTPPTATPTQCAQGIAPWHTELPIAIPRDYASGAAVGGKFYVIGGENVALEPPYVARVERFDPDSGTWDTAAPIPVAAARMAVATIGSKIYLAGGFTARQGFTLDLMQIYDSATDTWSQGAPMPVHVRSAAAAAYNGKIYIFGGVDQSDSNLVFEYDPVANTYTPKAPLPVAQHGMGAATIGGRIYVVGGYDYLHYAYDPTTDTWSTIALPPTPDYFAFAGVFALNGELWVVGGYDQENFRGFPPGQEVQIYNPTTNSWRLGPALNVPRMRSSAAAALNGRAYVAGGVALNNEQQFLTDVESTAYQACATPVPTMPTTPGITRTASPTAVSTGQPTHTSVPTNTPVRTGSPTVAPTQCAVGFADVSAGDYFYAAVQYLSCHGAISGYSDGTFRPYNNTTRGQLSKIVVLAAGWTIDTTGGPHFSDVPTTNPFYQYIETAYNHQVITGYADDTFRWGNNVTRGQLSKIVVLSIGWAIDTTGGPHFSDVPPSSPFYGYIETSYNHFIISGYADGTFRPGNNATRGQISKIVYLAVTRP